MRELIPANLPMEMLVVEKVKQPSPVTEWASGQSAK